MWVNSKFLDSAAGTHDFQKIFEFGLESVQFDHNQIEWHAIKINRGQVCAYLIHSIFTTMDVTQLASCNPVILPKQCIKSFVEGLPCQLSLFQRQHLIDFAPVRAILNSYWQLGAQNFDFRDRHLDIENEGHVGSMLMGFWVIQQVWGLINQTKTHSIKIQFDRQAHLLDFMMCFQLWILLSANLVVQSCQNMKSTYWEI